MVSLVRPRVCGAVFFEENTVSGYEMESLYVPFTLPHKRVEREVRFHCVQDGPEENLWVSINEFQHAHASPSIKSRVRGSCEFFGNTLLNYLLRVLILK
jgi:hypothetical protein